MAPGPRRAVRAPGGPGWPGTASCRAPGRTVSPALRDSSRGGHCAACSQHRAARFPGLRRPPVPAAEQDDDGRHEQGPDAERVEQHAEREAEPDRLELAAQSRSNVVRISTRDRDASPAISRVAAMPSITGILMSMSTTSGTAFLATATASAPSAASPSTARSGSESISSRKPARTMAWSSATTTPMVTPPAPRRSARPAGTRRPGSRPLAAARRGHRDDQPDAQRKAQRDEHRLAHSAAQFTPQVCPKHRCSSRAPRLGGMPGHQGVVATAAAAVSPADRFPLCPQR